MALPTCADLTGSNAWGGGFNHTAMPYSNTQQVPSAPPGVSFRGAIEWRSGNPPNPGFRAELWLCSGPGPTFTEELRIAQLAGAAPANTPAVGYVALNAILPTAGRVWNATTDAYRFKINGDFGTGAQTDQIVMGAEICGSTTQPDCCAELNSKLDMVLASIRRTYTSPA